MVSKVPLRACSGLVNILLRAQSCSFFLLFRSQTLKFIASSIGTTLTTQITRYGAPTRLSVPMLPLVDRPKACLALFIALKTLAQTRMMIVCQCWYHKLHQPTQTGVDDQPQASAFAPRRPFGGAQPSNGTLCVLCESEEC